MSEQFAVIDVSAWQESHGEVMGSKPKVWLVSPAGEHWLFKQARDSSDQAEDWSEKVAAELAKALNVPAATVELATNHGRRGVISRNVAPGFDLVHGNELLYRRDPAYERDLPRPARGYTLSAVKAVLGDCPPTPGWHRPDWTAYDVFAGYLMFDAFIANQDRHHENWAVLVNRITGDRELSPSFDHASSLGFLLTDADRSRRLETRDRGYSVQQWASRGRSHFEGRPSLVGLAAEALRTCAPAAAAWWTGQLSGLRPERWEQVLAQVPGSRISHTARRFASEMLTANRGRLLDVCSDVRA